MFQFQIEPYLSFQREISLQNDIFELRTSAKQPPQTNSKSK